MRRRVARLNHATRDINGADAGDGKRDEAGEHDPVTVSFDAAAQKPVIEAAGYRFELEKVAEASSDMWGMAFLPDGAILATLKVVLMDLSRERAEDKGEGPQVVAADAEAG